VTLLSICIPNFNQSALLARTFKSLKPYEDFVSLQRIEILCSDNSSTDGFDALSTFFPNTVKIYQQSSNLGFFGNFRFLLEKASGKYFWAIGSGDLVAPGFIPILLHILTDSDPDLLLLEATHITNPQSGEFRNTLHHFRGSAGLFREYCGAQIYQRKLALNAIESVDCRRQDAWPHVEMALSINDLETPRVISMRGFAIGIIVEEDDWHHSYHLWLQRNLELSWILYTSFLARGRIRLPIAKRWFKHVFLGGIGGCFTSRGMGIRTASRYFWASLFGTRSFGVPRSYVSLVVGFSASYFAWAILKKAVRNISLTGSGPPR
jgi:glycosyltransferase involved in cell wall biosynthesis